MNVKNLLDTWPEHSTQFLLLQRIEMTDSNCLVEWDDILGSGSLLRRRVIQPKSISDDAPRPEMGQEVTVHLKGWLADNPSKVFQEGSTITKRVGEGNFITGLDLAIRLMRSGEKVQLKISPRFGYGTDGSILLGVPGEATLMYDLQLINIGRERGDDLTAGSVPERLADASDFTEKIKAAFEKGDLSKAEWYCSKGLEFLEGLSDSKLSNTSKPSYENQVRELRVRLLSNTSLVMLKLEKWKECARASKKVLDLDKENIKALYRLALVLEHQSDYSEAMSYLKRVLLLDRSNKSACTAMRRIKMSLLKYKKQTKKMASAMTQRNQSTITLRNTSKNTPNVVPKICTKDIHNQTNKNTTATRCNDDSKQLNIIHIYLPLLIGMVMIGVITFFCVSYGFP